DELVAGLAGRRDHRQARGPHGLEPRLAAAIEPPRAVAALHLAPGELGPLVADGLAAPREEVLELDLDRRQRAVVEVGVGHEALMGLTARAVVDDAVDGRVRGAWEPLQPAEGREPHADQFAARPVRAVEAIAGS